MKESDIQILFGKVVLKDKTAVYELKLEKGKSIPFDKVKEHQILGLKRAKLGGFYHKLVDMPHFKGSGFRFDSRKPFDCLTLKGAEAYVAICFYESRKPKEVILIDIDRFVEEMESCGRKSITKIRAIEIAESIIIV